MGRFLNDVWRSDDEGETWRHVCDAAFGPRAAAAAVVASERLIVAGGRGEDGSDLGVGKAGVGCSVAFQAKFIQGLARDFKQHSQVLYSPLKGNQAHFALLACARVSTKQKSGRALPGPVL